MTSCGDKGQTLAIGGELKNTFCIRKGSLYYLSSYVGDMADIRTVKALDESVKRMCELLEATPQNVVCDMHPKYNTVAFAEGLDLPLKKVQHHYAHILSCMAENDYSEKVIGVSYDGTGFGTDGTIWGGEILLCDRTGFERMGSIKPFMQVGGDLSSKEGWRIAAMIAGSAYGERGGEICEKLGIPYVFKASFDKANRSSYASFRGPGIEEGLKILAQIKKDLGVPVVTDIHEPWQAEKAAEVVDILQIPAFLCRQTDLVYAAAKTGKTVNVKKGQFLAPWDMKNVIKKVEEAGNHNIMLTERGASFGYNTLVTDMRGLAVMRELGYPVVMDATHSVQIPGGQGTSSGGQSQYVPHMARAAAAVGIDALFLEVHDNPAEALSDGPNMVKLDNLEKLLTDVIAIDKIVRG